MTPVFHWCVLTRSLRPSDTTSMGHASLVAGHQPLITVSRGGCNGIARQILAAGLACRLDQCCVTPVTQASAIMLPVMGSSFQGNSGGRNEQLLMLLLLRVPS